MSVYYEALHSDRFLGINWAPTDVPRRDGGGTRQSCQGIRRALREAKHLEAEERNAATPYQRTRRYRRELAAQLAAATTERVEKKAAREKVRR